MGRPLLALTSGRKEGGEDSTSGQPGEDKATSGTAPRQEGSLSFLASGISQTCWGWLGTGSGQIDTTSLRKNVRSGTCLAK